MLHFGRIITFNVCLAFTLTRQEHTALYEFTLHQFFTTIRQSSLSTNTQRYIKAACTSVAREVACECVWVPQIQRLHWKRKQPSVKIHLRNLYWNSMSWLTHNLHFYLYIVIDCGTLMVCRNTQDRGKKRRRSILHDPTYNCRLQTLAGIAPTNRSTYKVLLWILTPFVNETNYRPSGRTRDLRFSQRRWWRFQSSRIRRREDLYSWF